MMAPPHRWFDLLVDAGWHKVLTKTELQILLAVGRRVDRTSRTRIKLDRLREESGLDRTTFFRAKTALMRYSLLNRAKFDGRWIITLPLPPVVSANHGQRSQRITDIKVSSLRTKKSANHGPTDSQKPPRMRKTADAQQKTEAQLEVQTEAQVRAALTVSLRRYLGCDGDWLLDEMVAAGRAVVATPGSLNDQAHLLSRRLQANNVLAPEGAVREALQDAAALAHPTVGAAVRVFDGEIIEVCALTPDGPANG